MRKVYLQRRAPHSSLHGPDPCSSPDYRAAPRRPDPRAFSQSNTTMTEIPPGLREEFLRGSIVHVHAVVIRKNKFPPVRASSWDPAFAEGRALPARSCSSTSLVDRSRRDHLLAAVYHVKSLFRQVVRIASYARKSIQPSAMEWGTFQ